VAARVLVLDTGQAASRVRDPKREPAENSDRAKLEADRVANRVSLDVARAQREAIVAAATAMSKRQAANRKRITDQQVAKALKQYR